MKRPSLMLMVILIMVFLVGCENNVYIDENIDRPKIWEVDGIYFRTANEAIEYVASLNNTRTVDVESSKTIRLLRHVLAQDSDGVALYGSEYVAPEKLRGSITVPESFRGQLCIDFGGYRYDFANNIDYFFTIKGGNEVYIYNGQSVIFNEAPHEPYALIVNTETVTIDKHLIDDRRVDNNLIYVGEEGHLKVQNINPQENQNAFSGKVAVVTDGTKGARLDIESSSIVIDNIYTMYKNATTGEVSDVIEEEQVIVEEAKSHININSGNVTILAINQKTDYYNTDTDTLFDKAVLNILSKEEKETRVRNPHELDEIVTKSIDEESKEKVERIILHNMEYYAQVDATCLEDGRKEYWYCNGCGGYFLDEEGNTNVDPSDLVISSTGHHSFESTWKADETHHWHECSVCHVHEEDIDHKSEQYIYDENNHWKECDECGTQFAIGGHQWGAWHEHTSGSVTHLIAECTICGATKTATKPEYLLFYIGIGEARLKALEDTPCGDFYINGESLGNNASVQVSNAQVTIEFKPFINSNKNFSPYCYVIHNGSMNQITTGTKDENGNYKVSFTLEDKKEYGVNIQLNTEGGSQSIICYLRLN